MAAVVLFLAAPLAQVAYYSAELRRGAFPPDADSISIPIVQFTVGLLMASPILAGLVWVGIRRYTAPRLFNWASSAPAGSLWWSGVFGFAAALCAWNAAVLARDRHIVPAVFYILCGYLALVLRAGAVASLEAKR